MPLTLFKISVPVWPAINMRERITSDRRTSSRNRRVVGTSPGVHAGERQGALWPPEPTRP